MNQWINNGRCTLIMAALLLALLLMLTACGGNEPATPTATTETAATPTTVAPEGDTTTPAQAAAAPTSALPTPAAQAGAPTAASPTTSSALTAPTSTETGTVTSTPDGSAAVFTPLEVEEASDCEIESHLDLGGYPNLIEQMGCPVAEAQIDPIGINEFGDAQPTDRFMLWFSHENQIYVLMPDGTYATYEDTWQEGVDPTHPCNPFGGEEDSPPLPRRGFGKLWCENQEIQEIMGAVPREERLCQYSVLQRFQDGRLLACFEDATIRYFRIMDDNTWNLLAQ